LPLLFPQFALGLASFLSALVSNSPPQFPPGLHILWSNHSHATLSTTPPHRSTDFHRPHSSPSFSPICRCFSHPASVFKLSRRRASRFILAQHVTWPPPRISCFSLPPPLAHPHFFPVRPATVPYPKLHLPMVCHLRCTEDLRIFPSPTESRFPDWIWFNGFSNIFRQ